MPNLPSFTPPIWVKAPLPHTPASSLFATAMLLEITSVTSIFLPAYFSKPCLKI